MDPHISKDEGSYPMEVTTLKLKGKQRITHLLNKEYPEKQI